MTIGLVNSFFSQDAGPPIFPTELTYWKAMLSEFDVTIHDLNLDIYRCLDSNISSYHLLACVFGGYTFSYPLSAFLPFNEFPFESVSTLGILLSLIYADEVLEEEIQKVSGRFGLPYELCRELLLKFKTFSKEMAEKVCAYDLLVVNMPSPASVIPSIFFGYLAHKFNPRLRIIGAGNYINVPQVARFAVEVGAFDEIVGAGRIKVLMNAIKGCDCRLDSLKSGGLPMPDVSGFSMCDYPLYHGLAIVPLETSYGCPNKCNFCSERLYWDSSGKVIDSYKEKDIERVVGEVEFLSRKLAVSGITFNDCLLNARFGRFEELFSLLKKKNLLYSGEFRVDKLNEKMIQQMAQARFTNVVVGVETLYKKSVKLYNKGSDEYAALAGQVIPRLYKKGIIPQQNILICHPYETLRDVKKAVEILSHYKGFLESEGVPFFYAPVGTVVLNYPSAVYFRVLNDPDFKIVYHSASKRLRRFVPAKVRASVEKIPYKAVRKVYDKENKINKIDFCAEIYDLWSKDKESLIQFKVAAFSKHKTLIFDSWLRQNIVIKCIDVELFRSKAKSPFLKRLFSLLKEERRLSVFSLHSRIKQKERIVAALLTLSMLGIVELVRRQEK